MRFCALIFLLLLAFLCLALAQGSYEDCCLKYVKRMKKLNGRMVLSYKRQLVDGGCNIPAIVFVLKKQKQLCADPKQPWVQNIVATVDKRLNGAKHSDAQRKSR
ncbi:C-C motif chemokine 20-like [Scleropages formosus]|uniref:C-C motif chemokine n=1 Tax=Scleropages formosus TaxID=113540 RepID=A0A8C9T6N4_SCLFO|nr:C-C motif chemokine 20-like [Scleropages formosus]